MEWDAVGWGGTQSKFRLTSSPEVIYHHSVIKGISHFLLKKCSPELKREVQVANRHMKVFHPVYILKGMLI
jgi:hypothetical protein